MFSLQRSREQLMRLIFHVHDLSNLFLTRKAQNSANTAKCPLIGHSFRVLIAMAIKYVAISVWGQGVPLVCSLETDYCNEMIVKKVADYVLLISLVVQVWVHFLCI